MKIKQPALAVALLLQGAFLASTAQADELPSQCSLSPYAFEQGHDSLKNKAKYTKVRNDDASMSMAVDCGPGGVLNGLLVTEHGSHVKVNLDGRFFGRLKGNFVLYAADGEIIGEGELKGRVDGKMMVGGDGRPVLDEHGRITAIDESIDGVWHIEGESFDSGKGAFLLEMDFSDFDPFSGFLRGTIKLDLP